jgi:hypothetical protein
MFKSHGRRPAARRRIKGRDMAYQGARYGVSSKTCISTITLTFTFSSFPSIEFNKKNGFLSLEQTEVFADEGSKLLKAGVAV